MQDDLTPIAGASLTLIDSTGQHLKRVLSDSAGHFWLWHSKPGKYGLRAERIGYAPTTGTATLVEGEVVELMIRMRTEPVPLDAIRVIARRPVRRFTSDEFYDRMTRYAGKGVFITRDDIYPGAVSTSQILWVVPGTWVDRARGGFVNSIRLVSYGRLCRPAVYIDGREMRFGEIDDWVSPDQIEGIEVYRGHFVPDTYRSIDSGWGCGMILIWRRPVPRDALASDGERATMFAILAGLLIFATFGL